MNRLLTLWVGCCGNKIALRFGFGGFLELVRSVLRAIYCFLYILFELLKLQALYAKTNQNATSMEEIGG